MITLTYDGSFEGLLTAVFEVYAYKYPDAIIEPEHRSTQNMFSAPHVVRTDEAKALRVWKGLASKLSPAALNCVYRCFLSEQQGMETEILEYIRHAMKNQRSVEKDYNHAAVKYITDMAKKVHREKHRMEAFVRFKLADDGLYVAEIEPDFNVLPLIRKHFEGRYADQNWLIFDPLRHYGLFYDQQQVQAVTVNPGIREEGAGSGLHETEKKFQQLWAHYFENVNIRERKNLKLHLQHMPRRYWKFLPEKTAGL